MADVPYGRGGSPLQNLIRRGHAETKLAALRCVAEMDAGPVYLKRPLALSGTAEEIFLRAADLMEEMIEEMIETRPKPVEQSGEPVIFRRLRPEDGDLAAAPSLRQAFDMIRMLDADGYPPAFVRAGGYRFEFSRASLRPGEIVADVRIRADDEGSQ
jgi:methionyl-tRNA formyltransferase